MPRKNTHHSDSIFADELNEMLEGNISIVEKAQFAKAARAIIRDLEKQGFDKQDVVEYLHNEVNRIADES